MTARAQNIGIKAIEVYFPTQVSDLGCFFKYLKLYTDVSIAVCRPSRAREVRWRCCWQIHHWSRPDQDELL